MQHTINTQDVTATVPPIVFCFTKIPGIYGFILFNKLFKSDTNQEVIICTHCIPLYPDELVIKIDIVNTITEVCVFNPS